MASRRTSMLRLVLRDGASTSLSPSSGQTEKVSQPYGMARCFPYRAAMVAEALPLETPPLEDRLEAVARAHGFAAFGIARADAAPRTAARLNQWLAEGCNGDMLWMESRADRTSKRLNSST